MFEFFLMTLPIHENTSNIPAIYEEQFIYEKVPEGILLKDCGHGYGLFASKSFKSGEILYKQKYIIIGEEEQLFLLITDQGEFHLSTTIHSVGIGNGKRSLYTFDSLINHSCDANSYSLTTPEMASGFEYFQVASKDIEVGDQITCDYNLFDYDCSDKNIQNCLCGSSNCRKEVKGFRWLPLDEQIRLLPTIDQSIVEQFFLDHPEMLREIQ